MPQNQYFQEIFSIINNLATNAEMFLAKYLTVL